MKNIFIIAIKLLTLVFLPFYIAAYIVANATKMSGHEDMPSLTELFEMV